MNEQPQTAHEDEPEDNESSTPEEATEELADEPKDEVTLLQEQVTELEDRLKRAYAEQQNQRQRMLKEKASNERYAGSKLATDLLDVIDNLERAVDSVPVALSDNNHIQNLIKGVGMVTDQFEQVFATHGIARLYPMNESVDYNYHETIAEVDDNPAPPHTVIDVLQAGYLMKDRLLRPAKVVISSGRVTNPEDQAKPVDKEV